MKVLNTTKTKIFFFGFVCWTCMGGFSVTFYISQAPLDLVKTRQQANIIGADTSVRYRFGRGEGMRKLIFESF